MITDKLNTFSAAQVITATAVSTNVIDLGPLSGTNTVRDIGQGEPVQLSVRVGSTALAGGTSIQAVLETSLAEGSGYTTLMSGPVVPVASLGAGAKIFEGPVPTGVQRYLRINYVVVGPFTSGNVNAGLVETLQNPSNSFGSGYTLDT